MSHTLTYRHLTQDEIRRLKCLGRLTADSVAWILLPVYGGFGLGFIGGTLLKWLLAKPASSHLGILCGTIVGCLGIIPAVWLFKIFLRWRSIHHRDIAGDQVEVLAVTEPRFVEQKDEYDGGPIFYLDIGQGMLLFVWGQWMLDPSTYSPASSGKEIDENCPPFPTTSFVLHRVPISGTVLQVEIKGQKLKPERMIEGKEIPLSKLADSLILKGSLNDLKAVMEDAMRRPKYPVS